MSPSQGTESLRPQETAQWSHVISAEEVEAFIRLSGDTNPLHTNDPFAQQHGFRQRVVHGMLLNAFVSRIIGTVLPGPGALWLSESTRFLRPVYPGDRIEAVIRVAHRSESLQIMVLKTAMTNQRGDPVLEAEAKVMLLKEPLAQVPWAEMVVVITGASRGIGAGLARALGRRGVRVVVNYREHQAAAEAVVASIQAAGGQALAAGADVATVEGAKALASQALAAFGRVDVLINNATPPIRRKHFAELAWVEVDQYWRTYVQSAFTLTQEFLPGMKERGFGRVVNILTSFVLGTPPGDAAGYVAAKHGLWGLTKALAVELAPYGITVNGISPSPVLTEQWEQVTEARRRALALRNPMRRLATPEDVANLTLSLIGEGGAYVTGVNLPVTGGEVM